MPSDVKTPRGRMRWLMVFMAFLATAINYIDRANLGVAAVYIQSEFGLTGTQIGALMGAFFWTYAFFQLPSGWFVDKVGPRVAYSVAVVWWSVFTAVTAFGRGFASLFVARLLLGVGEAPAYPTNAKVVAEWFPKRERAFATSIYDSGNRVGTALAMPIVSMIILALGWRWSFIITGMIGFVWTAVWIWLYRAPREHPSITPEELAYIEAGQVDGREKATGPKVRWRDLFKYRTVWGMMLGFFCLNFVIYFFSTWFPTYLLTARGLNLKQMGIVGMVPALCAIGGGYIGGLTGDRLVRSGMSLTRARKIPLVGGMVMSSCIGLSVFATTTAGALAWMSLSYSSLSFAAASVWSLPADVAPTKGHVASIGGIQNFASNLAGICISMFIGAMFQRTGGFTVPLLTAGGFCLLGAFSYLVIVGDVAPLDAEKAPAGTPPASAAGA